MYMSDAISWRERACTSEPQMPLVSDGVLEQAVITVSALFVENVMKKFKSHPGVSVVRNLPSSAGDASSVPGFGGAPGGGNGTPLQCSCPGNPTARGATAPGVTKELGVT